MGIKDDQKWSRIAWGTFAAGVGVLLAGFGVDLPAVGAIGALAAAVGVILLAATGNVFPSR